MERNPAVRILFIVIIFLFLLWTGAVMADTTPVTLSHPPIAKQVPHVNSWHGQEFSDPYAWLRNKTDEAVLQYLQQENAWTEQWMKSTEPLQKNLYDEMVSRIKEDDQSVPVQIDDWFYYHRVEKGRQYPIYCRTFLTLDATEEILLDVNQLAEGESYMEIGAFDLSPDHSILAYSTDNDGSEKFTTHFKLLNSGTLLPDTIPETSYSGEWSADGKYYFYTVLDPAMRPWRLMRHKLGTGFDQDVKVYQEDDEKFFVSVGKSRDRKILFLSLGSQVTSEIRWLEADKPEGEFKVIFPRRHEIEYGVEHHKGWFWFLTNEGARNFKLMRSPVSSYNEGKSEEVVAHQPDVLIEDFDLFENWEVLYLRENGLKKIRIRNLERNDIHFVEFPEPAYTFDSASNPRYDSNKLRFVYYSLVTPRTVYDYEMDSRILTVKKTQEVPGGYDKFAWTTQRLMVPSHDGVLVPVSIVTKRDMPRDGQAPLYLTGYGAYGMSTDTYFSTSRLSMLERGFAYAIAHVRGGEEMGRQWYEDGKKLKKKNSFLDLVAVAEFLARENYTRSERIVISGGSAGGLLVGAACQTRPEAFGAVVAEVPFLDVINTMMDPDLPLTVTEYDEWGNPNEKEYFDYMRSYAPYENVKEMVYPHILATGGLNDPRVGFWEPAKWVARMRATRKDDRVLLLRVKMAEGHGGASGRYDYLKDIAFEYAFILKVFGMAQ